MLDVAVTHKPSVIQTYKTDLAKRVLELDEWISSRNNSNSCAQQILLFNKTQQNITLVNFFYDIFYKDRARNQMSCA